MSKLITKARAGVTLVELLVVILIVTILSVSLLPMFKDYIVKSQYAAEAIPVIGNLRTKIGLYQYEHNTLPPNAADNAEDDSITKVSTWSFASDEDHEKFVPAYYEFENAPAEIAEDGSISEKKTELASYSGNVMEMTDGAVHLGSPAYLDIDFQDLKGKRSRPFDYFYYKLKTKSTDSAYVVGCFGSGDGGFAAGTGYAVCELNLVSIGKKYIGTFERYKAREKDDENKSPCLYLSLENTGISGDTVYCPQDLTTGNFLEDSERTGIPNIVDLMEKAGWSFTK